MLSRSSVRILLCSVLRRSQSNWKCDVQKYALIEKIKLFSTQNNILYVRTITKNDKEDEKLIEDKLFYIKQLNFKCPQDAVPFMDLPIRTLIHLYKTTENDKKIGFCENRLYYIADRIQYSPTDLSALVAKRTFVYSIPPEWLKLALDVLLEMGVKGELIARDLWVLKYKPETIKERLEKVRASGVEKLTTWMVRCTSQALNRAIEIQQEAKEILGDDQTTLSYLANRLNISPDIVKQMCIKAPTLNTMRVTKLKSFLDFLIAEGFTIEDIVNRPTVLSASQKTVKQRIDMLRKIGHYNINLNTLRISTEQFNKYYEFLKSARGYP